MSGSVVFEVVRYGGVAAGFYFAYKLGGQPVESFHVLTLWVVNALSGLTGLESLVLGSKTSASIGYAPGGAYQRQSGMNNLAVAIAVNIAAFLHWGVYADAALMSAAMLFFLMSGVNHAYSAVAQGNLKPKNLSRPIGSLLIVIFVLPIMIKALQGAP